MTSRSLAYPLHVESLTAGLLFYVLLGFYFGTFSFYRSNIVATVVWLVFVGVFALLIVGLLFEYGIDIMLASATGDARPPGVSANFTTVRAFTLAVLFAAFATIALQLGKVGWTKSAWTVWSTLLLLLPAFVLNNALFGIGAMLNPVSLVQTVVKIGWSYCQHLVLLALVMALLVASLSGPFLFYVLLFPVFLYCNFLFFHLLGLSVHAHNDKFFTAVDFKADREELKQISASLVDVNRELRQTYECLRAGRHDKVQQKLSALLQRNGAADFELLFTYTSQWFSPAPAVYLCKLFLEQETAMEKPMRALALAQWALEHDTKFALESTSSLQALAESAITAEQYRTVLQLCENHLKQQPAAPQRTEVLALALQLAGEKLQDEARFVQIKTAWA